MISIQYICFWKRFSLFPSVETNAQFRVRNSSIFERNHCYNYFRKLLSSSMPVYKLFLYLIFEIEMIFNYRIHLRDKNVYKLMNKAISWLKKQKKQKKTRVILIVLNKKSIRYKASYNRVRTQQTTIINQSDKTNGT